MAELFKNLEASKYEAKVEEKTKLPEATKTTAETPKETAAPVTAKELETPVTAAPDEDKDDSDLPSMDELTMLKSRATMMGVKFSNNIGVDALRAKVKAKLEDGEDNTDADGVEIKKAEPVAYTPPEVEAPVVKAKAKKSLRQFIQEREMKLIRVRITNMDPKKNDLPGEVFTVANEFLGTVRKYIPYGEHSDNGYHIPVCILNQLNERKFVSIKVRKDKRGQSVVEYQDAKEFSIEVLPPLTATELAQLATAQQAAGGLE